MNCVMIIAELFQEFSGNQPAIHLAVFMQSQIKAFLFYIL